MHRCASCGSEVSQAMALCPHHHADDAGWAATNRIMCDFLHRGISSRRLPETDRVDDLRGCLQEAA